MQIDSKEGKRKKNSENNDQAHHVDHLVQIKHKILGKNLKLTKSTYFLLRKKVFSR